MATVSSITPRPAPRCPPVADTAEMVSWRSSSASCGSWSLLKPRISDGNLTVSSSGVSGRSLIGPSPYADDFDMSPIRPSARNVFSDCSGNAHSIAAFVAIPALAAYLDDRSRSGEAGAGGSLADAGRKSVVVDVDGLAAIVADQEDAVVEALGVLVRDIGILALDPAREVRFNEQVEDSIDAVRSDAPPFRL